MLKLASHESRDASNDLLYQLGLIDVSEYLDTIKGEIGGKLDYLKSCDDFCSLEACNAITVIKDFCWSLNLGQPKEKMCSRLVDFLLEQGLGQLIVKILVSLTSITDKSEFESWHQVIVTIGSLTCQADKQSAQRAKVELVKCGVVRAFLNDLDSCDPNTDDPRQHIRITGSIFGLQNLVNTEKVIPIYRAAKAVNILMKFRSADNVMTKIAGLRVLACIVNETESEFLVANRGCIATMVDMVKTAAESTSRTYEFDITVEDDGYPFQLSLLTLTRGIGNVATNDANKEAILQHGGVPVLTSILRPEFNEEEKQAAAEALWKLSFLESNLDVILPHLNEEALKGISDLI